MPDALGRKRANQGSSRWEEHQCLRGDLETVTLFIADRTEKSGRIVPKGMRIKHTHQAAFQVVQAAQFILKFPPMFPIQAQSQSVDGEIAPNQVIMQPS